MNRAQRRATGSPKEPTYTLTKSQIQEIKKQATDEAVDAAFKLMLCIPATVIHQNFSKIMKKEGRVENFLDLVLYLYESYNRGDVSLEELQKCLEEAGISFQQGRERKIY